MSSSQIKSTPVRFPCPQCEQLLSIREEKSGRKVRCPKCKVVLVVPSHEAAAQAVAEHRSRATASQETASQEPVDPFAEMVVYDDAPLTYDASYDEPEQYTTEVDADRVSISRRVIYGQGILIAAVALVALMMGFSIGRLAGTDPDEAPVVVDRSPTKIRGRLVHKDAAGKEIADDGAVVIVLPRGIKQDLTGRLATSGLSPGDPAPGADDANVQAISALGGAYRRADESGHFQFTLPPGKYYILRISHNAQRGPSESLASRDVQVMGDLLADVSALIGPYKYRWQTDVEIAKATTLDYSFE
jgi:phage FluMu protein Com